MERSHIFKVPIGLQKTIVSMLKTGIVDTTLLGQEDRMWLSRWGYRLGIVIDGHNYAKQSKPLKRHKSTNPDYIILEVLPDK
jgi:hypothetical protein